MGNSLILFGSSFIGVLLFGLQSQWVRDKHQITSFICSLCIGLSQLVIFKHVPDATFWEAVFWIFGGAFGVVASIHVHNIWLKYYPNKRPREWYVGEYDDFYGPKIGPKPSDVNTIQSNNKSKGMKND